MHILRHPRQMDEKCIFCDQEQRDSVEMIHHVLFRCENLAEIRYDFRHKAIWESRDLPRVLMSDEVHAFVRGAQKKIHERRKEENGENDG